MDTKFTKLPHFYKSDVVYAKHPETGEMTIGEIDYITEKDKEKPYLVYFKDGADEYYSYDELEKAPLSAQVLYLKEEVLEARNRAALTDAGYDCLLWDSNVLEDRVLGLIKQYREGNNLDAAIEKCENALGGKEVVNSVLDSVYKKRDYNF